MRSRPIRSERPPIRSSARSRLRGSILVIGASALVAVTGVSSAAAAPASRPAPDDLRLTTWRPVRATLERSGAGRSRRGAAAGDRGPTSGREQLWGVGHGRHPPLETRTVAIGDRSGPLRRAGDGGPADHPDGVAPRPRAGSHESANRAPAAGDRLSSAQREVAGPSSGRCARCQGQPDPGTAGSFLRDRAAARAARSTSGPPPLASGRAPDAGSRHRDSRPVTA